jgi:signal transduction histidine kinase
VANLVANALDATATGGTVLLTTSRRADNSAVTFSVRDTGTGLDEATLARVFDPFFTTKPRRIGSGLGLTVVHGIARYYGGSVAIESEPGRGTTVTVSLPSEGAGTGTGPSYT